MGTLGTPALPGAPAGSSIGGGIGYRQGSEDVSGSSTGEEKTKLDFDAATKAYLDKILASTTYSKEAAISDSAAAAKAAQQRSLELGIPGVSSASRSAGGYSSTAAEMLTSDVAARSEAASAQVTLDAITKYAAAQAGQVSAATGAVAATTGKTTTSKGTMTQATHTGSKEANLGFSKATVICTQLYLDGHISRNTYFADMKYVSRHFSETTQRGYRFWAVPLVRVMRKDARIYSVVKYFGTRWSLHCASHHRMDTAPNWTGRILIAVAAPICWIIGNFVQEVPYLRTTQGE